MLTYSSPPPRKRISSCQLIEYMFLVLLFVFGICDICDLCYYSSQTREQIIVKCGLVYSQLKLIDTRVLPSTFRGIVSNKTLSWSKSFSDELTPWHSLYTVKR